MRRKLSFDFVTLVALLIVAVLELRAYQRRRLEPFAELTRTYLQRALADDSAGVRALAADDTSVTWALALARHSPDRVRAALKTMRARRGAQDSVRAVVFFRTRVDWCAGVAGATDLQATFHQIDRQWKIHYAGPGLLIDDAQRSSHVRQRAPTTPPIVLHGSPPGFVRVADDCRPRLRTDSCGRRRP